MKRKVLVISIKPEYAFRIINGEKTIELRKSTPNVTKDDIVIIYATEPIKAIIGYCKVKEIVRDNPSNLWVRFNSVAGISEKGFWEYYGEALKGTGIILSHIKKLDEEFPLKTIRKVMPRFSPPQSFSYLTVSDTINYYKTLSTSL